MSLSSRSSQSLWNTLFFSWKLSKSLENQSSIYRNSLSQTCHLGGEGGHQRWRERCFVHLMSFAHAAARVAFLFCYSCSQSSKPSFSSFSFSFSSTLSSLTFTTSPCVFPLLGWLSPGCFHNFLFCGEDYLFGSQIWKIAPKLPQVQKCHQEYRQNDQQE